jgi:hypothetical protein
MKLFEIPTIELVRVDMNDMIVTSACENECTVEGDPCPYEI